jgi:hypothetical protein
MTILDLTFTHLTRPASDVRLWRYMDLGKLLSLLESRCLAFPRVDTFEDPFEGHWSLPTARDLRSLIAESGAMPMAESILNQPSIYRERTYASCWHSNDRESDAMWKLYLSSPDGVAISTTSALLTKELQISDFDVGFGEVNYLDFGSDVMSYKSSFDPYFHKRREFAHESEVRAVIWAGTPAQNHRRVPAETKVVFLPVRTEILIKQVHISPRASSMFADLIPKILKRYKLECEATQSEMYRRPPG